MSALRADMKGANADLGDALEAIRNEVHLDTVDRLKEFVTQAAQSERDLKAGKKPLYQPTQIAAVGISGWLQGQNSAQTDVEFTRKLLFARDMAMKYLRCDVPGKRAAILADYEQDPKALKYDELEQLIALLPPPIAQADLPVEPVVQKTETIPAFGGPVKYTLQLPPEYQHGRPYPLLLVLPDKGQKAQEILEKIGDFAAKNGQVVAIVDWEGEDYENTPESMAIVTGLLRHTAPKFPDRFRQGLSHGLRQWGDHGAQCGGGAPRFVRRRHSIVPGSEPRIPNAWEILDKLPIPARLPGHGPLCGDAILNGAPSLHRLDEARIPGIVHLLQGPRQRHFQ